MIRLPRSGYRSRDLMTDVSLGLVSGLSLSLWSYVYAAIVFVGVLSPYLPVGILVMLLGWVLVSVWVVLTSPEPLHIATTDDQAVVIFGSISALMIATMGETAASPGGLSTILFIMAFTTLMFAAGCYAVGRFKISHVLEMLPYPVVCGFMASVGWLLLVAGFEVTAGLSPSPSLVSDLAAGNHAPQLLISMLLGLGLLWTTSSFARSWTFPLASLAIVLVYHLTMALRGIPHAEQLAAGWLFDLPESNGNAVSMLAAVSPGAIDWSFVATAFPLMLTVLLISLLYASMTVTGLRAESREKLNIGVEFQRLGVGNLFCVATCCPPGYTDVVSTVTYRKLGASSRWFVLTSSAVGLGVAVLGGGLIGYLPKVLMGANIFLFAFYMLYDWLYRNVRGFDASEYLIVVLILSVTILVGFLEAVGAGIIVAAMLFVVRYSQISAIRSHRSLREQRSSVERSDRAKAALDRLGERVSIYHLRGFLFFGTANAILDAITEQEKPDDRGCEAILIDFGQVTGIDVSALHSFGRLKSMCESAGVAVLYSGLTPDVERKLRAADAVMSSDGLSLLFDTDDLAMEYLEDELLQRRDASRGELRISDILAAAVRHPGKVEALLRAMERVPLQAGEALFRQGDPDNGLYVVEQGYLSAFIESGDSRPRRVKKFSPGSLVGEVSRYLSDRLRTATIIADTDSVVFHLDAEKLDRLDNENHELHACVHELVAYTLAERVSYMNRRLMADND